MCLLNPAIRASYEPVGRLLRHTGLFFGSWIARMTDHSTIWDSSSQVMSGFLAVMAKYIGSRSLFAQYFLFLDPTHVISPELSFQFALIPALGGLGTAIGPVLGAFVVTPLSEFLRSYFGGGAAGLHLAIYGALLIVVMLYFPGGIAGALMRLLGRGRPQ